LLRRVACFACARAGGWSETCTTAPSSAYFVVAETLTNVAKHASATHASVSVTGDNHGLMVEVGDDGVGGAGFDRGTGLRGLADRLAAIEGRLEVESEPGRARR
jgi:signal transduction histidine kinase